MTEKILGDARAVVELARRLNDCPEVARVVGGEREGFETLAYAIAEIEESLRSILERHLPRLADPDADCSKLNGTLLDIGEELRHVMYHVKDAKFYAYLME
jgi:hypothetical protein